MDDFKVIAKILVTAYPAKNFLGDEYSLGLWYKALQDIPYPILNKAVTNYVMTSRYPPTIADIRELSYKLSNAPEMLGSSAWNQLIRALRRAYSPESQTVWEQLPDITKMVVGGYTEFRQWAKTDITSLESVQRPMFIKRFEEYQKREMTAKITPQAVRVPLPQLPEGPKRVQIEEKPQTDRADAPTDRLKALRERLNK